MVLLIKQDGEQFVIVNVTRIEERRTPARTLMTPFKGALALDIGEIDLATAEVTVLPEDPGT